MRIYKVKKIKELIEESGSDKDFMESEWVAVDDLNKRLSTVMNVRNNEKDMRMLIIEIQLNLRQN